MSGAVGVGVDIVELQRIRRLQERYGAAFMRRFCRRDETPPEGLPGHRRIELLGGLFASKEAVLKALGTGWAQGLGLLDVEVIRNLRGRPEVRLHGAARRRALELGGVSVLLSISHEKRYVVAVAILRGGADK